MLEGLAERGHSPWRGHHEPVVAHQVPNSSHQRVGIARGLGRRERNRDRSRPTLEEEFGQPIVRSAATRPSDGDPDPGKGSLAGDILYGHDTTQTKAPQASVRLRARVPRSLLVGSIASPQGAVLESELSSPLSSRLDRWRLSDFPGGDARRADPNPPPISSIVDDLRGLEVGKPTTLGLVVRVAYPVPRSRSLATHVAYSCHCRLEGC